MRAGQERAGQESAGQERAGQVRAGQVSAGQVRAGQERAGQQRKAVGKQDTAGRSSEQQGLACCGSFSKLQCMPPCKKPATCLQGQPRISVVAKPQPHPREALEATGFLCQG